MASKIQFDSKSNKFIVPDDPIVGFIEGDGVGPDIWKASQIVFDAAVKKAYGGKRKITWEEVFAGDKAFAKTKEYLPKESFAKLKDLRISIKGPMSTPVGGGIRSLNVAIRQELDLYNCIRPVKYYSGVPAPVTHPEKVNMTIFRENTEDVYSGVEFKQGSEEAKKIIALLKSFNKNVREDSGIGIKPVSSFGTKRLMRCAIKYAIENKLPTVTIVHKGNIMKFTEGAFREWAYQVAKEEFGNVTVTEEEVSKGASASGKIIINDRIADNMLQQVLIKPDEYSVICTLNLNGDYLSDALAAQVGGLGIAPGGNVGDGYAVFEATHGTAPKYAGQDKVNPSSVILSGAMMLETMGWKEAAVLVDKGIEKAIKNKTVTYDFVRGMTGAKELKCSEFGKEVARLIEGM